jgi:hypothetical protein
MLGSYVPRWTMSRAAVVHMGRIIGVNDGWLEQALEVAHTLRCGCVCVWVRATG